MAGLMVRRGSHLRLHLAAAVAATWLATAARARPRAPELPIELAAAARDLRNLRRSVERLARALSLPADLPRSLDPCGPALRLAAACEEQNRRAAERMQRCREVLGSAARALLGRAPEPEGMRPLAAVALAQQAAALAFRLRRLEPRVAAGCIATPGSNEVPADATIEGDGRGLLLSPSRPLIPGGHYALVLHGPRPPGRPELVPGHIGEGAAIGIPPGAVVGRLPARLRGLQRAASFARRLEAEARHLPGIAPRGVLLVRWKGKPGTERLLSLQPAFLLLPERQRGEKLPEGTIATMTVMPVADRLAAYREAIGRLECPEPGLDTVELHAPDGHRVRRDIAAVLHGRFHSLDIRGGQGDEALLGRVPEAARPVELDFLLSLPAARGGGHGRWPVVIMAHGLMGSGGGFLSQHAEGLAGNGLAAASIDLPDQGGRARPGRSFVDPLDPRGLALNLRQAAVDLVAFSRYLASCPLPPPAAGALAPGPPRFLGFSLGSMVGVIVRAVEPLGATVLAGSGGDLGGWLIFWIAKELRLPPLLCVGGPGEGRRCEQHNGCPAPGACVPNPLLIATLRSFSVVYPLLLAPGEPLSFARAAATRGGPLLLQGGSRDATIFPMLTEQLAVAMGLARNPPRVPPTRRLFWLWPGEGHGLLHSPAVRRQAYAFLASSGARLAERSR